MNFTFFWFSLSVYTVGQVYSVENKLTTAPEVEAKIWAIGLVLGLENKYIEARVL